MPEKNKKKKYKFSKKTRQRMSKSHTGKHLSAETKAKISAARQERQRMIEMGLLPAFRHTAETKAYLSKLARRQKRKPSALAIARSKVTRKERAVSKREAKRLLELATG